MRLAAVPKEDGMSLESVTEELRTKTAAAAPLGHTIKFDLGTDGVVFWDGTGAAAAIDNTDRDAEAAIAIALGDFEQLLAGQLDPTMAYMTGKLKLTGSMGVALKIGEILRN